MPNNEDPKKEMTIAEEAGLPDNWVPIDSTPIVPSNMAAGTNPYGGGSLPPNFNLQPDTLSTNYKGPGIPAVRLMPVQGNPAVNAQTQSIVETAIAAIPPTVIPAFTSVTDGLIHGRAVWDGDAAVFQLTDDFNNYLGASLIPSSSETTQIGQLGWTLSGTVSTIQWWAGGQYPNMGQYGWANAATLGDNGLLLMNATNANQNTGWYGSAWALGESSNWWLTWVFKTDIVASSGNFNEYTTAGKSIYVGLVGTTAWNSAIGAFSRPDVFVGLRFDTTTGIGDSFFTFEAVANTSYSTAARHNTQGSTQVTNVAPTQGTWHRLDIYSTTPGTMTMVLDGSSTNTFTVALPQITITPSTCSTQLTNNVLLINANTGTSPHGVIPFSSGSIITTAGYTGTGSATFDGTFVIDISANSGGQIYCNLEGANIGANTSVPTITGYPALTPSIMYGNDGTVASPTGSAVTMVVDYFSFVQNPGVGGGSGTPVITDPRFFV